MIEEKFLEQILLNLGDKAPWLVVVWILAWKVWPGVQVLVEQYLSTRTTAASHSANTQSTFVPATVTIVLDDSVKEVVNGIALIAQALGAVGAVGVASKPPVSPPLTVHPTGPRSGSGAARSSESGTGGASE